MCTRGSNLNLPHRVTKIQSIVRANATAELIILRVVHQGLNKKGQIEKLDGPVLRSLVRLVLIIKNGAIMRVCDNPRNRSTKERKTQQICEPPSPKSHFRHIGGAFRWWREQAALRCRSGGFGISLRAIRRVDEEAPNEVDEIIGDAYKPQPEAYLHVSY